MNSVKYAYDHNTDDYVAWDSVTGQTLATGSTAAECLSKCDLSGGKPRLTSSLNRGRINPRELPYSGPKGLAGNAPHSAPAK